ncbi:MAG: bifunctional 4-hydroxy-3-methylbut-2-enyl diphosphate reductase/30S ribosomal protein S1 [Ruminococcaceae bacterium]|nr:bifunctional 4-hydroxy-3-methylbut-2-enyl diphosphate reductase/30S ribosomal protein S1 [Oscillospiraceae bacterium]
MLIKLADTAGFCFGVNRAIDMVENLLSQGKKVATLGPIINNSEVVNDLADRGAPFVNSPDEVNKDTMLVIRSHGVAESVLNQIKELDIEYADATCPFVRKIHKIVKEAGQNGSTVIIAGDSNHPEVKGIIGHTEGEAYTFKNEEELINLLSIIPKEKLENVTFAAQTTFDQKEWKKCLKFIKKVCTNAKIFDTICSATYSRQAEAENLAKSSDLMIIVGDTKSSNTSKLYEIAKRNCPDTLWIQTASDLLAERLSNARLIGVTAGASTPARIIKEVLDKMEEMTKSGVTIDMEENFEALLEENLKSLNTNERVMGTVISMTPTEVYVDVGRKQSGFIPVDELSATPVNHPSEICKVGDEMELLIMKTNDVEGTIMLSKRRVDSKKYWEQLEQIAEDKTVITGKVTEVVNGGVIVVAMENRVFVPASQATLNRTEDLSVLLGETVDLRILEASQRGRRKKLVGSIRSVLLDQRSEQKAAFWENVKTGDIYTGVVKSLTSYGAFVDLGGVFGMIHISELSWSRIKHPSEVVNVGDTVEVYIKDINTETNKISLGFKKAEDNPWEILKRDYPEGTVVKAKIAGLTTFGAFATIIPGIDGLIHISQLSNKRVEKPQDVVKVGDEVEAKIVAIEFDKKRVSLSMAALIEDEEPAEEVAAEEAAE